MGNFNQNQKDAVLSVTKAMPAAEANNDTDIIDLGHTPPSTPVRGVEVEIEVPAMPNNSDNTKTATLTLHDSADGTTFAEVDPLNQVKIPGVASTGSAAKTVRMALPSTIRRYIRFNQVVATGGGDNTAVSPVYTVVVPV